MEQRQRLPPASVLQNKFFNGTCLLYPFELIKFIFYTTGTMFPAIPFIWSSISYFPYLKKANLA
jgi:hypothetical protein